MLCAGTLTASFLLIAPVALWARFGSDDVLSTLGVALVALGPCCELLRRTSRAYARRRHPARRALVAQTPAARTTSTLRIHGRQVTTAPRERRAAPSRHGAPSRCRPIYISRFARDIACPTSARSLRGRTARRRTRP